MNSVKARIESIAQNLDNQGFGGDIMGANKEIPHKQIINEVKIKRKSINGGAKRAPSAYNKFVSQHRKNGLSMKQIGELWKKQKEGPVKRARKSSGSKVSKPVVGSAIPKKKRQLKKKMTKA